LNQQAAQHVKGVSVKVFLADGKGEELLRSGTMTANGVGGQALQEKPAILFGIALGDRG